MYKIQDEEGYTALTRAAMEGHIEVAEALLAAGADTEKLDSSSRTALAHAQGKQAIVQLLQSTD